MQKWNAGVFIMVLLSIFVFSGCVNSTVLTSTTGGEKELTEVKVAMWPYFSYAPLFIAEEEGYFEEQGIEVEFIALGNTLVPSALAQGDVDVSAGFLTAGLFNGMARGLNIKIVADKGFISPDDCASNAILARKDLIAAGDLDFPTGLDGKTIAIDAYSIEGFVLEPLLIECGVMIDNIKAVDMPPPAELDAFESGAIDLSMMSEPWVTRLLDDGNTEIWKVYSDLVPDQQWSVIMYGPNFLEKNPDLGNRFMAAYLKAVRLYNEGRTDRNLELLANFTGQDIEFINRVCWPTFRSDGGINSDSVIDFQVWAENKGLQDQVVTEENFWDGRFVEYANDILS